MACIIIGKDRKAPEFSYLAVSLTDFVRPQIPGIIRSPGWIAARISDLGTIIRGIDD
jgi:hypothetical protein